MTRTYTVLSDLGLKLYRRQCFEVALNIAVYILDAIHGLNDEQFAKFNGDLFFNFVDLLLIVEHDVRFARDVNRYHKLESVFHRLPYERVMSFLQNVKNTPAYAFYISNIIETHPVSQKEGPRSDSRCGQP